ncbi:hypothetical protein [Bradyrhizobium liaoningense]|jgi:hypothetical protein
MEEASLLMPVRRAVGGVEIEDDPAPAVACALPGTAHGQRLDPRCIMGEPLPIQRENSRSSYKTVPRGLLKIWIRRFSASSFAFWRESHRECSL